MSEHYVQDVPECGDLTLGAVYARRDIHKRFQGNRYAGIVPSKVESVVLLFHTEEPSQQFYADGFDEDGVYWYSGEGAVGDMQWTSSNREIRDHEENGKSLYLFERVQRTGGLWIYSHVMHCIGHRWEERPDKEGVLRKSIVFALMPLEGAEVESPGMVGLSIDELRDAATRGSLTEQDSLSTTMQNVYRRTVAVRQYALKRSGGLCEACGSKAPFVSQKGEPYLEVHHIERLSDYGPDRIDSVAAICPNCHRRCHYGRDAADYNAILGAKISRLEHANPATE